MRVILIIVIIIITIVFLAGIDFFRPSNFSLFFSATSTTPLSFENYAATPTSNGISAPTGGTGIAPAVNTEDIPSGFTAKQLSPWFRKVRVTSVSTPGADTLYNYEHVALTATLGTGESVNVNGWTLLSNRGAQVIPQAARVLDFSTVFSLIDIVLRNGDAVNFYSTPSPIGINFRSNKCIGYLNGVYAFTPQLPEACPTVDRSDIVTFTGVCQDYILSLNPCERPAMNPAVPLNDYACRSYLQTLDYQGCVNRERRDADFPGNEWFVWTGRRFLDERHDRILVFDRRGLLVDEYVY